MVEAKESVPMAVGQDGGVSMTGPLPRVAVLLAAYNGMNYIAEQIQSILAQVDVDVTIFVSVDRSTDGTEKWVEALVRTKKNVILLPYGQHFGGAAPNFFHLFREVDFSSFDYVSLADQDDIWSEKKLFRAHEVMSKNRYDAYSSNVLAFWPSGRELLIDKAQPQVSHDYLFEAAGPGCTYVFAVASAINMKQFMLHRWEEVNGVGLHDWFFYAWYRANGLLWFIDDEWHMRYRQHGVNQVGANQGFSAIRSRFRLLRSGWYGTEVARIAVLVSSPSDRIARLAMAKSWWVHLGLLLYIGSLRRRMRDRVVLMAIIIFGVF